MKRIRRFVSVTLAIVLLSVAAWIGIWLIRSIASYASAIPKELGAPIVAGVATVFVATLTVVLGKYYERKRELDALYRDKKTEVYDEFLKKFFELYFAGGEKPAGDELVPFLREFARKLLLWGGPGVIEAFLKWKDHLAKGEPDAKSVFLTEEFILAVREDLRHTNKGIRRGLFARMFLKNSELFLAMAARNPDVKLAEIVAIEKAFLPSQEK